jgi:molybdenum cofactor cytidylyltransferase
VKPAVPAIVLAAGASRRLGRPKQLLLYNDETLLGRAIRLARESGANPIVVVLGAYHQLIRDAVALGHAMPILNDRWEQGIGTSIHAGLSALDADVEGCLIMTCDQPRLTPAHLCALLQAFATQTEPSIAASAYAEIIGIPAVFPRAMFGELLALRGDKGARSLLMAPQCAMLTIPFAGGEIDIDLPVDVERLS